MRRLATALLVLALLAAACGDDAEDQGASTGAIVEGSSTTTPTDATSPADGDDGPANAGGEGDGPPPAGDDPVLPVAPPLDPGVELTASFRGVTEDTITLGYTSIDFELLNNSFGLDLAFQNFGSQADAIVDWYNENGGVLGRQLELVHETYLPVGATSADEVCVKLTEDVTVFAVLGGFAGPGAQDVTECFPELHDTIVVGPAPRPEQAERAGGLWVSTDMSLTRRNEALAQLLADAGVLDELGSMMVIGSSQDEAALVDVMADALRAHGVDVPFTDFVTTTGDRFATAGDVSLWIEEARSSDISTIVMLGEDEFRNQEFFIQAPDLTYVIGNGDAITDWQSIPPEGLAPGTRVITNNNGPDIAAFDDPGLARCIEVVEEALGVEILATSQLPDGDPNYFAGTVGACRTISLFVQIATEAGPDLTNDSWVAALDRLDDLAIPGYRFASLRRDKVDARDQLVLVEFDLDTLSFDPISDPIDVG